MLVFIYAVDQGCPSYGSRLPIFNWPGANSKNIMAYGPHMKFVLDCNALLGFNTRGSYCLEQDSLSTKQDKSKKNFTTSDPKIAEPKKRKVASAGDFRHGGKMNISSVKSRGSVSV